MKFVFWDEIELMMKGKHEMKGEEREE